MDFNVYIRNPGSANYPLIWWSPVKNQQCSIACQSLEDFRKLQTQFAVNSRYFSENSGMIFKSTELGDYQVLPAFARTLSASRLPENIARLLGQTGEEIGYVGAYPLQPLK